MGWECESRKRDFGKGGMKRVWGNIWCYLHSCWCDSSTFASGGAESREFWVTELG